MVVRILCSSTLLQDIANEAPDHGLECRLVCMEDYKEDKEVCACARASVHSPLY